MLDIPRRQRRPIRMEVTSLIDCVFLLLIFFMLSSSFLTPAVSLTLPTAANDKTPPTSIVVTLDQTGQLFVDTESVSLATLESALRQRLQAAEKKDVTFRGDKEVRYELFLKALSKIRAAGAVNVHVAHESPLP